MTEPKLPKELPLGVSYCIDTADVARDAKDPHVREAFRKWHEAHYDTHNGGTVTFRVGSEGDDGEDTEMYSTISRYLLEQGFEEGTHIYLMRSW